MAVNIVRYKAFCAFMNVVNYYECIKRHYKCPHNAL